MKLSTKSRYGTRALLELAFRKKDDGPMLLRDIADKQQLPLSYLEQIVAPLISGGVIRSTKGPGGGISLSREPKEVMLSEVIKLLEGSIAPVGCVDDPDSCERSSFCVTRDIWSELKEVLDKYLGSMSLQDLVDRQGEKNPTDEEFCI